MKKIILLLFTLCCFATISWGQKDTIRTGEGPYDWPDFLTSTEGSLWPILPGDLVRYTPGNPEQAIFGIGVVAAPSPVNGKWGVKLYSSMYGSSVPSSTPGGCYREEYLQCELQVPYTSTTPYSYFNISRWNDANQIMRDTTVYIYNFYFETPYYVVNYDTIHLGIYDSLDKYYHILDPDYHPIVYQLFYPQISDSIRFWSVDVNSPYNKEDLRICDTTPVTTFIFTNASAREVIGIFPIISRPPESDTIPACNAVVENLRFVRQGEQYGRQTAVVAWDAIGNSTYTQVRWGRYTVDSLTSEITLQDGYIGTAYGADTLLIRGLDTGWYACRVRAVCEHECFYHDETDYSEWSDTLYFYMTAPAPDTTAITQTVATLQVRIAPNPVQGKLMVNTEQEDNYTIEVYNNMGVRLLTDQFTGTRHRLDVSRLPKGHYILAFASKQGSTRLAFVKQ